MALGPASLISAVAYEFVGEAFDTASGGGGVAAGLFAGALTFFFGDMYIEQMGGATQELGASRDRDPRLRSCSAPSSTAFPKAR